MIRLTSTYTRLASQTIYVHMYNLQDKPTITVIVVNELDTDVYALSDARLNLFLRYDAEIR